VQGVPPCRADTWGEGDPPPEKPKEKFSWTRVDEIIEYAKIRGMKRLGIATCYALMSESRSLSDILERNDFTVVSVSCLCGEVNPQDVGMPGNIFCNPIMQAGEGTQVLYDIC
jgi:uncharacterized metal-binding protein